MLFRSTQNSGLKVGLLCWQNQMCAYRNTTCLTNIIVCISDTGDWWPKNAKSGRVSHEPKVGVSVIFFSVWSNPLSSKWKGKFGESCSVLRRNSLRFKTFKKPKDCLPISLSSFARAQFRLQALSKCLAPLIGPASFPPGQRSMETSGLVSCHAISM